MIVVQAPGVGYGAAGCYQCAVVLTMACHLQVTVTGEWDRAEPTGSYLNSIR